MLEQRIMELTKAVQDLCNILTKAEAAPVMEVVRPVTEASPVVTTSSAVNIPVEEVDLVKTAAEICKKIGPKTKDFTAHVREVLSGLGFAKLSKVSEDKKIVVYSAMKEWEAVNG